MKQAITMSHIISAIQSQKVLPLFFYPDFERCSNTIDALYQSGIRVVEFTNRGEEALQIFSQLIAARATKWPELLLGIGTVRNAAQAQAFIDAECDFLISPFVVEEIAPVVNAANIVWMPGCITPYEINLAVNFGCTMVKLFPGNLISPDYVKAIREIFPSTYFMPTGGVGLDPSELKSWFTAGVSAVGMGSKLVSKELLEKGDYATIAQRTKTALEIINAL